jgi:glycerol-3-phosphate dehydrogenase
MTHPMDRTAALDRLAREQFDVLVIGGGITGAGVALDSAARGLHTALVERADFASGTSSKSSKLVHGGLRYLQQKEYLLVYENLAERQRLLQNAPHLVQPLAFLIPLFGADGVVNKALATGGVRIGKRHTRVSREEALAHMPTLRADRLAAAFLYWDARTDDARLTLEILRTAVLDHGAVVANYAPVVELLRGADRVVGARLADGTAIRAHVVVNAAGVWSDDVRALDEGTHPDSIRPAKGIHVTVPADRLPCDIAAVIPVRKDRRSIFVVPWGGETYIGTTDTDYDGPLDDPQCTPEDVSYILDGVNSWITTPVSVDDVTGVWAGLRPLVKGASSERTADLSRRHQVTTSASGVVSITGGKLTTYRKMAADTVDAVVRRLGHGPRRSPTKRLPIRGAAGLAGLKEPSAAARLGVDDELLAHLAGRYGGETPELTAMISADPALADHLVAGLPYRRVEAVYAVRQEMARTIEDVLSRRTRALLRARDASGDAAEEVARLVGPELGWSEDDVARETAAFRRIVERERAAAALPVRNAGA